VSYAEAGWASFGLYRIGCEGLLVLFTPTKNSSNESVIGSMPQSWRPQPSRLGERGQFRGFTESVGVLRLQPLYYY